MNDPMMGLRRAVALFGLVLLGCQAAWAQGTTQEAPTGESEHEFTYATMSDGVRIALAVGYPRGFDPHSTSRKWPAMFEMQGYDSSTVPQRASAFGDQYVTVRASLRGAGASGGTIQAISHRNGLDGYEVIENWIVQQPWSNGKVAMHGHSWGGLSAFMVAATNPPHLSAVAVSGLLDDIYRDIGRPGGVRNAGFPVEWMVNLYQPTGPFGSSEAARRARGLTPQQYQDLWSSRPPWDLGRDILWNSLVSATERPEFAAASPGAFAAGVRAPIHIMHAYQDEQTGPSGLWLWTYIPDDVPKRLVLSNGDHGDVGRFAQDRLQWLNYWTLQDGQGEPRAYADAAQRVQVHFETPRDSVAVNRPLVASNFPLPQTRWTRYYFRDEQQLSTSPPTEDEGGEDTYVVTVGQADSDLDGIYYMFTCDEPLAVCGPIAVSFWASSTTVDTDFYVALADVDADGVIQLLQRGLLRGSHYAIDKEKSLSVTVDSQPVLVRPRHTHRDIVPLVPGRPYRFDIEVFPVGHVFRAGHQLALWISQPLSADPVTRHQDGRPAYWYESMMPPGTVRILRTAECPSHVVLPILPELPPMARVEIAPGGQAGIFTFDQ